MCGIAGGIGLSIGARPDPEKVRAMSRRLSHRGPDGEGFWISPSGRACLAHRRLSVIDLAGGSQPMIDGTRAHGIVFNGEIYNYLELRETLARKGEVFRTMSDTEVLQRLLMREGEDGIEALRGMFAFVAWDDENGTLIAARDRIGKKPLFFIQEGECLYFASSLGALRDGLSISWELDIEALDQYLTLGYIPAPRTIYQKVYKLPAATIAISHEGTLSFRRYWDLAQNPEPFEGGYEEAIDRLESMLETAVALRLRSDVPLGVLLSGGIDSSLVTALAARQRRDPVDTFSIGFGEDDYDESRQAAKVARHLGTRHHSLHVESSLIDLIPQTVAHFGEPYADASALPTWAVSALARPHVTVALGGDGGDEGFAGYEWYRTAARLGSIADKVPLSAWRAASAVSGTFSSFYRLGRIARGLNILAAENFGARFAALRSFVGRWEETLLYAGELQRRSNGQPEFLIRKAFERAQGTLLRQMRYADIETYLADNLMPKVDVASMAHGLEVRAPLLDQEVLRFALSLPDSYLYDARGGKRILRDLLLRHLPRELVERPKRGFSVPLGPWFRSILRPRIEALGRSERLGDLGLLRLSGIRKLSDEHISGRRDHSQRLYSLLILDEWLASSNITMAFQGTAMEAAE